jgi:hypothetical protein
LIDQLLEKAFDQVQCCLLLLFGIIVEIIKYYADFLTIEIVGFLPKFVNDKRTLCQYRTIKKKYAMNDLPAPAACQ